MSRRLMLLTTLINSIGTTKYYGRTKSFRNYTSNDIGQLLEGERSLRRLNEKLQRPNGLGSNTFQGFNYSVLENDADFNDFVHSLIPLQVKSSNFQPSGYNTFPTSGEKPRKKVGSKTATARKFFTVKQMIMYFQKTPLFGKFAYYGCWCFPDGPDDMSAGYGEPVDDIDRTCKKLNQCYRCASMKFGKNECPSNSDYQFQGLEDAVTGRRYVDCLDEEGTCPRSLCECDRQLASSIAELEDEWEQDYHSKWGNFNREETCRTPANLAWGKEARSMFGHHGSGGGNQPDACCGKEGELFPYNTDSGRRSCCGSRTFNTELMKCCPSSEPHIRPHSVQC